MTSEATSFSSNKDDQNLFNQISSSIEGLNQIFKNEFQLKTERINALKERKKELLIVKKVMDESKIQETIVLNVGGMEFLTSKDILKKIPNSFFDYMLSGEIDIKPISNQPNCYFIDRDGSNFKSILNYLKNFKDNVTPVNLIDIKVREELVFYNMETFLTSKIITDRSFNIIKNWIGDLEFSLLYRASENRFEASSFNEKCNRKGATITLIEARCGDIFGVYNSASWGDFRIPEFDKTSFFFILSDSTSNKPTKYTYVNPFSENSQTQTEENPIESIVETKKSDSIFGRDIRNDFNFQEGPFIDTLGFFISDGCNNNFRSYRKGPSLFSGSLILKHNFIVKEYEVFKIFKKK
ncbi:hypothetical protein CYY_005877 [Polysphondylium violaceum]|uniref:BTB domain-containing protein n=1 Tax=Polysphondylium violaceum TaxID=133409 RepID=A0A8J4PS63_9MYCE|nr:hypothetical protein CYY_005877 [Polysphondylium violaceum]